MPARAPPPSPSDARRRRFQTKQGLTRFELSGIAGFGNTDSPGGASDVLFATDEAQQQIGQPGKFLPSLVLVAAVAGVLGMVAALVPAWRAGRLKVLDAIRTE